MNSTVRISHSRWPVIIGALAFAIMAGLGFAGWLNNGADMLIALTANGLAWCF